MDIRVAFMTLVAMCLSAVANAQGPVRVSIERDGDRFVLMRGGEPYFVKGAGGYQHLELLVESGGNSFRTWGAEDAQKHLDRAQELGLTVTLGIWLGHERHGFDYTDAQQVQQQREMVERVVREFKDHPALLMWGLGNEVALTGDPRKFFPEIEHLANMVKEIDPNHPVMTVLAGIGEEKMDAFLDLCPSVDVLGVNKYGNAENIPQGLLEAGYDGPYIVTEYGPRGWWESPVTAWGAQIEPTSAEKAEMYRRSHQGAVMDSPDRCLGSYVFLWGQKQEATATWFGMFLEDGAKTPTVDVMHRFWKGRDPENRAPVVFGIDAPALTAPLRSGSEFDARVEVFDADGDDLQIQWLIKAESTDRKIGGDAEASPDGFPSLTLGQSGRRASLRAPAEPGAYRLFVTVYDGKRAAGTANTPFLVE